MMCWKMDLKFFLERLKYCEFNQKESDYNNCISSLSWCKISIMGTFIKDLTLFFEIFVIQLCLLRYAKKPYTNSPLSYFDDLPAPWKREIIYERPHAAWITYNFPISDLVECRIISSRLVVYYDHHI